ncbi:MAG TPA: tartrate-resistant acid phosphatase type 5 family protein [Gemmatimonadaceae bacterium]|uniref:acid phosphatase n=1 Tax=uncultured Gemmatimonadetes bacterium Rifle_16ft_4_minimus_37772 TaxID=1665097 RepID=A0A0H4T4X9_9BACT|nr:acid phosphatase [uncultured Gemmatimonadetes bacterium Rifle_16ft_4_minimus_37772]HLA90099.1 tartrate-resistant acid phosphatase type 5 family protein [Gemmatimonadaceae bacterium]
MFPNLRSSRQLLAVAVAIASVACSAPAQKREPLTLATPANALSFLVIGDWGQRASANQQRVARQMGPVAAALGAAFVVSTGDNFYPDGVRNVNDAHFRSTFENVYSAPSLMVDWYVVLGNHDYHGNPQAEVEYSAKSTRWKMPARYYAVTKPVAPGVTADFIFIDTSPLVADFDGQPFRWPGFRTDTVAQRVWLDSTLKASTAQWKFIVGHHHVYSGGVRGTQNFMEFFLVPRMEQYGVNAYICGHEHHIEHIAPLGSTIHYFISGAGSEARSAPGREGSRFVSTALGFLAMSLTADTMVVQAVDLFGKVHYRTSIPRVNGLDPHGAAPLPAGSGAAPRPAPLASARATPPRSRTSVPRAPRAASR